MKKWEYHKIKYNHSEMERLGKEGWELVSVVVEFTIIQCYFKRELK